LKSANDKGMINYLKSIHRSKNLNIDIGNKCTLGCSQCARTIYKNKGYKLPGTDMTLSQFDKLSNYFKGRMISFCGTWSDPIYNPKFIDMLKMCKDKKIEAEVHTAASHRPEAWYEKAFLANTDARWIFGIDGLPSESHNYRVNQDGEKLFNMMIKSTDTIKQTVWQYLVFDYNKYNIEEASNLAAQHNIFFLLIHTTRL